MPYAHPLLVEDPEENRPLWQRQKAALAVGADEIAVGRMCGEITAEQAARNGVRGYNWYMNATDDDPEIDMDDCVYHEVIAAVVGHAPDGHTEDDVWSVYTDPVPPLVAEVRRLAAVVTDLRRRLAEVQQLANRGTTW